MSLFVVYAADECADLALQQTLNHRAELLLGRVLEVEARVAQSLMLAHFGEPALGRGEGVLESAITVSGPAKSDLALVGPRPNCSL
jgi:hypothetical protein